MPHLKLERLRAARLEIAAFAYVIVPGFLQTRELAIRQRHLVGDRQGRIVSVRHGGKRCR